jgi:hypothetical protein
MESSRLWRLFILADLANRELLSIGLQNTSVVTEGMQVLFVFQLLNFISTSRDMCNKKLILNHCLI